MVSKKSGLKPRLYSFYCNGIWDHNFNQCAWYVPQKSIAGAVGLALRNAPYSDSDRTGVFQKKAWDLPSGRVDRRAQRKAQSLVVKPLPHCQGL